MIYAHCRDFIVTLYNCSKDSNNNLEFIIATFGSTGASVKMKEYCCNSQRGLLMFTRVYNPHYIHSKYTMNPKIKNFTIPVSSHHTLEKILPKTSLPFFPHFHHQN